MFTRTPLVPALIVGFGFGVIGCRASDSECVAMADHVVAIATAEGKATSGTAAAIEHDCVRLRPTRGLIRCMIDAQSLAEIDAC